MASEEKVINERPRICCIDIDKDSINLLEKSGYNISSGTLGKKVKVPNISRNNAHHLLLNYNFPSNLHEYDIIVVDLDNYSTIDYKQKDHTREEHTGKSAVAILSSYPETVFDPRPLGSLILNTKLIEIGTRPHIIIAFSTGAYDTEYETIRITDHYPERQGIERYNIYSFAGNAPLYAPKIGKEMIVCDVKEDLKKLLETHLPTASYNQTFRHPTSYKGNEYVENENFVPLIKNSSGDIISICESRENSMIFYLPQIENKGEFLNSFLSKILTDLMPELFPFSTTFNWKESEDYWLPNHKSLLEEKVKLEKEYAEKINIKDSEIVKNKEQYLYLHNLLTATGDDLVEALVKYFKWLGFTKINKVDEDKTDLKILEEDIQIQLSNGILIIECKGIGGTSTDSDCSQISKIKHRRCKERGKFDVYALYIVNHQRYLPPLTRQNPPFTENQIQDAQNDERGLLTTWQLFNAYYEIEDGIITKEEVRNSLLNFGLIEIKPENLVYIDEPKEILKNGEVCIINITEVELKISEEIFIEKNGKFQRNIIEGIQLNEKPVSSARSGEIGLKLRFPIKKKSILWKKASS
ncbi:hypothetical protein [Flavobacterium dankookense]|uniref:Uncharacterized protein n=1 Tax=Flavobacterium dankookense TaxID=706186 RepID=A0A4R6Q730_9FLAO|nr:hypothetical protein [Flavobacterium dankookense]TDP58324.1 hypothetical protein BC748_2363 [Flavobacterium dankookense]